MKKLLLILALLAAPVYAVEEAADQPPKQPEPLPITATEFEEFWAKYYAGMNYHQALQSDRPLILIFADSPDVFAMFKRAPLGDIIFKQFDGKYNCTIINVQYGIKGRFDKYVRKKHNPEYILNTKLAEEFFVDKYPAMFLVDPKERTYQPVDIKDITEEKLPTILYDYLEKTLPQ